MNVEIRCPRKVFIKKYKSNRTCNRFVLEAEPGSAGNAYCVSCGKMFAFEVSDDFVPLKNKIVTLERERLTPVEDAEKLQLAPNP